MALGKNSASSGSPCPFALVNCQVQVLGCDGSCKRSGMECDTQSSHWFVGLGSKVPCAVAIRTARAVVEEVPQAASSSLRALSRCNSNQPERSVQNMTKKFCLAIPIPRTLTKVASRKLPFLKMTDWAKFLMSMNLQHILCGLKEPDPPRCQSLWTEFWNRFQCLRPSHPLFQRRDLDLSRTCALLLHGDEGRSQKKAPILCVSTHSFMGFGLATSRTGERDGFLGMKLNYEEPTWTTRFLLGVLPKSLYGDEDEAEEDEVENADGVQDLLGAIAADLQDLYINGVVDLRGERHHFIVLNCMGDWPWLVRAGCLSRSFYNGPKAASSKTDPKGICHLCKADMVGYPWEDWRTEEPEWMQSINTLRVKTILSAACLVEDSA